MHGRLFSLVPWALGAALLVSGCADAAHSFNRAITKPFRKTTEQEFGIKTPKDRVKEFRALAKKAEEMPPAEQEQQVAMLSREFDAERDGWVRREIIRAAAQFPQPAAGAILVRGLQDSATETRRVACTGLGIRADEIAVRELVRVIGSETDPDVRMSAVAALGATGDKTAIEPLAEALADGDPAMQAQAQRSLVAVSGHDYGSNVEAWREFAQKGATDAPEISLAEKLRRAVY